MIGSRVRQPEARLGLNATANIAQAVIGAGMLFALYRYINGALGIGQLGIWSVVIATVSASRLADLGLSAGVTRFVARHNGLGAPERAASVIDTATMVLAVAVSVFLPIFYILAAKLLPFLFTDDHLELALSILPIAMLSLWLTIVAGVSQGGMDGCQRMELRAGLVLAGQLVLLAFSWWLVPIYGLAGLALAQVVQGIFLLVCGRLLLRLVMRELPFLPRRYSKDVLREMLGYGANLQANTIFVLLFDPVAKALIARFGGPSSAGYFEMASQVVLKVRAVIVCANQAVVPHVASWADEDHRKVIDLHRDSVRLLLFVTLPTFAILIAASPLFSVLLIGSYSVNLVVMIGVLAVGWAFNLVANAAYFINLGTGYVADNTLAHAAISTVSGGLGLLLGPSFGASGVLLGYISGLIIGSAWLMIRFGRRHGIVFNFAVFGEHMGLLFTTFVAAAWSILVIIEPRLRLPAISVAAIFVLLIMISVATWRHGVRGELAARLRLKVRDLL